MWRKLGMSRTVLHEPTLRTIMMVEKAIKDSETYLTRKHLWKSLPRQIQYQTFTRILDYLEGSNKIVFDRNKIVWVAVDNPKLKRLLDESVTLL